MLLIPEQSLPQEDLQLLVRIFKPVRSGVDLSIVDKLNTGKHFRVIFLLIYSYYTILTGFSDYITTC